MTIKLNNYLVLICILFGFIASFRYILPGYISMQDDMHVFRLQQFDTCIHDMQIPCRQIPDGGLGYGYPLFNFYSPLPYAVAESFHLLGLSFIDSLKISFIIPNFVRAISMFLLASSLFGPFAGILSSALYTFAPYLAVDSYVRGALAEFWALSLIPLVTYSLIKSKSKLLHFSLILLLLSHNLTLMYFLPFLTVFSILNKKFVYLLKNSILPLLITSFFVIPAYLEKNLVTVNTMTQGYFSYIIHFATIKQLFFSNYWGYSASQWGPVDGLSLQVGYLIWTIPLLITIYLLVNKIFNKNIVYFLLVGLFATFLTHNQSTFLWKNLSLLQFYQFPWRFLGIVVFCFSLISGYITMILPLKYSKPSIILLILITIIINLPYFHEDIRFNSLTDNQKLSSSEVTRQSGAGLMDYWTKSSAEFPTTYALQLPLATKGSIENIQFKKNSKILQGHIFVTSESATINFPQSYFPNWYLYINGQPANYQIDQKYGQLQATLSQGSYYYTFRFSDTPIRQISNTISLFGISLYIIILAREKKS